MNNNIKCLLASALLLTECGLAFAGNTGVQFAAGVNAGNINSSSLTEISGCAASRINDGIFWMHNDSGDRPRIFAISKTGVLKATYNLSGASAADYEDIAVGPGPVSGQSYVYVGDIGDNGASRNTKQIYRLPEPKVGTSATTQSVEKFNFVYPDGPRDAETLMVDANGDVYVVSKRETAANGNRVYRFKAPLVNGQTYTGVEVARIHTQWLTGGDIAADGSRILIRDGGQVYLWLRYDGETVGAALSRAPIKVPTVDEPQGEAVCWDKTGTDYYTTSENLNQPLYYFKSLDSTSGGNTGGGGTTTGDTPTSTNSLQVGKQLNLNQYITSSNASYRFYLQGDGNLVLRNMLTGQAKWAAATNGKGGVRLVMQGDGNLVLYTSSGSPVWASGTNGKNAAYLIMQNDGNLVLDTSSGAQVWATNTSDGSGGGSSGGTQTGVLTPLQNKSRYDHVVIAIMENEGSDTIMASSSTPYIHSLANQGVRFTASKAVTHPSQPNYLALFSGSTQGVTNDDCPKNFTGKANLASQLIAAGFTFKGYSESMPYNGYTGCSSNGYVRKHNPWVDFDNVPASSNLTYAAFPSDFSKLPTVSVVVPNQCNNMHDCSLATGDNWLKNNIDAYAQWAKTHNSLLILTWDEDGGASGNVIPTIFVGANITPGTTNSQSFNHYGLLRTLEDMYGLTPLNNAASASPITGSWLNTGSSNGWTAQAGNLASSASGSWLFTMLVPSGATNLKFTTAGGSGDADMYVKFAADPTTSSFDCRSATAGSTAESCTISAPQAGTYHVLLKANSSYSGVQLNGSYSK